MPSASKTLLALCFAACPLHAVGLTKDDAILRFTDANRAYEAGEAAAAEKKGSDAAARFDQAAREYEAILDRGYHNGQIFFNLANTYYRLGKTGKAIANYRRAQRLLPRDDAIAANLRQASRLIEDKASEGAPPELLTLAFFWYFYLNFDELLSATLAAYGLLALLLLACIFSRRSWLKHLSIWAGVAFGVLAISLAVKCRQDILVQRGVVTAEAATVRYGNGAHYSVKFSVHEGAELIVRDERRDDDGRLWVNATFLVDVKAQGGNEAASAERRTGWAPADAVEKLSWPPRAAPKPEPSGQEEPV